jgi:hypothetical protein
MYHLGEAPLSKGRVDDRGITNVSFNQSVSRMLKMVQNVPSLDRGIVEGIKIVENRDGVVGRKEFVDNMGANEPSAAGHENIRHTDPSTETERQRPLFSGETLYESGATAVVNTFREHHFTNINLPRLLEVPADSR